MLDSRNSIKIKAHQALTPPPQPVGAPKASLSSTPISPKSKSPRPPAIKRGNDLNSSSEKVVAPGGIAAVRREQMALQHTQRKMRIAHYGRSKSAKFDKVVPLLDSFTSNKISAEEKRSSFIMPKLGMFLTGENRNKMKGY